MAKGKKQAAPTKKKQVLAKRFKCPFCANGEAMICDLHILGFLICDW
jgi:transcription elongation factor Elf1